MSKDSARSTGYRRILFQNGKNNDGESRWRGCGSDTVPHVFFMDSRGIFQFVKKIQTKKYLFFDEKKILEIIFQICLDILFEIFDLGGDFIKGL